MSCDCNTLVVGEAGAPGPQGLAGINGDNGTNGINAFTTTSASFVQPALNVSVTFSVVENRWIAVGQTIYISNAGFYRVTSVGGSPYSSVTAVLVKTDGVVNPSTVSSGLKVSPSSSALYTAPLSSLNVTGPSILDGAVTVNSSKAAVDFVVNGDTADNLLIADASSDRVGINIAVPTATLDVAGTLKVLSAAEFRSGATVNASQANSDFSVQTQVFTNTLYVDASTDRVGIATSSPLKLLDVAGDAQINTLLVNPGGVADNIKPVFQVLGTSNSIYPITVKATSGPTVNRVGIFNASPSVELDVTGETKISGNLSVDTNVLKVDSAANFVGINKTTPTVALDVTGELAVSGVSTLNSLTVTGAASVGTTLGVTGASTLASLSVTGAASVGGNFSVETSTFKVDTSSNHVGVNTSSPTVELDVVGETKISGDLSVDTNVLKVDSAGNLVGINKTTPTVALDVVGATAISGDLAVDTNVLKVDVTGNFVGINKTTPTVPLDVTGAVQATSYQIEASAGKITKFYKSSVPLESTTNLTNLTGAGTFQTYTHYVPGVLAGDFAQVTYSSSDNNFEDEVMISAYCTSDNVNIVFFNMGATDFGVTTTAEITINIFITRAAAS
jgi:hypothetical protein